MSRNRLLLVSICLFVFLGCMLVSLLLRFQDHQTSTKTQHHGYNGHVRKSYKQLQEDPSQLSPRRRRRATFLLDTTMERLRGTWVCSPWILNCRPPPASAPTATPTSSPTSATVRDTRLTATTTGTNNTTRRTDRTMAVAATIPATAPKIESLGETPPNQAFPLQRCQGDCDIDKDCADNLICFQRIRSYQGVPGCGAGRKDVSETDYCINPDDWPGYETWKKAQQQQKPAATTANNAPQQASASPAGVNKPQPTPITAPSTRRPTLAPTLAPIPNPTPKPTPAPVPSPVMSKDPPSSSSTIIAQDVRMKLYWKGS
jgi:hypothetical protein